MRYFDDDDRPVTEFEVNRERYWRELKDMEHEADMERIEEGFRAQERWLAQSVGKRLADELVDACCLAAREIVAFLYATRYLDDEDIPF